MKLFTVYAAKTPDEKWYIGITSKPLNIRKSNHFSAAKRGSTYKFHTALRKHGKSVFWIELGKTNSWDSAKQAEREFISLFDSYSLGLNSTLGGSGVRGKTWTPEQKLKMAKTKGAKPFRVFRLDGTFVGRWENESQCARDLNCKQYRVWGALRGKHQSHYGYVFKWEG